MNGLIGKWVLMDSVLIGGVVDSKPHFVTGVSGQRVYVSEATQSLVDGIFIFDGGSIPAGYRLISSIKYQFDTIEDCASAGSACRDMHWDWWTKSKHKMKEDCISHIIALGGKSVK